MTASDNHIIKDTSEGWTRSRCIYAGGREAYLAAHGTGEDGDPQFFAVAVRFSPDADISPKDYSVSRVLLPIASAIQNAFFRLGSYCAAYDNTTFLPSLTDVAWGVRSSAAKLASQGDVNVEIIAFLPHVYRDRVGVLRGLYDVKSHDDDSVRVSGNIMHENITASHIRPSGDLSPTSVFIAGQPYRRSSLAEVTHESDKILPLRDMFPLEKIHYGEAKKAAIKIHDEMVNGAVNVEHSYVALRKAVQMGGKGATGLLAGDSQSGYAVKVELVDTEEGGNSIQHMVLTLSRTEPREGKLMPLEVKSRVIDQDTYFLTGIISYDACSAYARAVLAFHAESLGYDPQGGD